MKRLKFLLVDDSAFILQVTKDELMEFVDCDTAINGQESIEKFKQKFMTSEAYDVILMDITMPDMSGIDAVHEIRTYENEFGITKDDKVKIFMLTALREGNIVIDSMLGADADDYIVKPFTLRQLSTILDSFGISHGITIS